MTIQELQDILTKAVRSTALYQGDAAKVVEDKNVLSADEAKAVTSANTARDDVKAGADALASILSGFPTPPVV